MKTSVTTKLVLGLILAVAIFVTSSRASLEDVLAPLPFASATAATMKSQPATVAEEAKAEPAAIVDAHQADRVMEVSVQDVVLDPIDAVSLQTAITVALEDAMRPNGSITLNPLRELPDLSGYAQPFSVTLVTIPSRLGRGNLMLRFRVDNEKGVLGEWNVPFNAHVFSEVWYPKAHLRSGNLATPSDFEIREVDLLAVPDAVPARMEVLLRHEYSRDLLPGRPLVWKDLMERSLVRKGDVVEVSAVQGLLAISMRAVARQDGADGAIIILRNIESNKEFPARVTGEGRAEIIF